MNGILPIWKEPGLTSHDCVFKVRKLLKMKKVGHTGTLDPDVDGVLPICLGRATKIAEYITDSGKSYRAEVTIGSSTATEDASGEVISRKKVEENFTYEDLTTVLSSFEGQIKQTPPMYSAVKVNGKRLYEYARQGIMVERPTRTVQINRIRLVENTLLKKQQELSFSIDVDCGKGTYIRTLAVMIGERLGYPAHMSKLTRTSSAAFTKENCVTLSQLAELAEDSNALHKYLRPLEEGISQLKNLTISDTVASKVKNGAVLSMPEDWTADYGEPVVLTYQQKALAIYHLHPSKEGLIKPVKVLWVD
ncbi:tRNA pseudouridine(55) synthase TruB [Jeotgalibacillus proteolyticus]|uniref:tRNA pseudouridine synthase B n=1 Tax=Jeotgalibacillus proteolyticus TaxID=2082395 RepID=A0A2S5GG66_9BACL|nr:tRNA pseudouridine(55) synthase TruB [Jeotgalibacillus proteolyticus]PPA72020.1 tRNA pseudouridine(55) synthase TruB [Jeotgalibacillus proteolyticus]